MGFFTDKVPALSNVGNVQKHYDISVPRIV
jgi:hypothetical protein